MIKRSFIIVVFIIVCTSLLAQKRNEINFPDIQGYKTLKCDFHIHSVFSDGSVWPTIRVEEAWREGLDAIAITEHIEYLPHKKDIIADHNRAFEIASPAGKDRDIVVIHGSEITLSMPPGHSNALFLKNSNLLDTTKYFDAFMAAKAQNAFIFWNHPAWSRQQPDTTLWWKEHTELYEAGLMHGIEVVNEHEYSPEAHKWAIEKKLTMLGNSDIHNPIQMDYDFSMGEHRPMTLVLAKEKSVEGIRDALMNRRTIVYHNNLLIGDNAYLKELFEKSIRIEKVLRNKKSIHVTLYNSSSVPFEIKKLKGNDPNLEFFRNLKIEAGGYTSFTLYEKELTNNTGFNLQLEVDNLLVAPATGMPYKLNIQLK